LRKFTLAVFAALLLVVAASAAGSASAGGPADVQVYQDGGMVAKSKTMGGADVLPTTRTLEHWYGTALDPHNGVTYGYNMVGKNPFTCGSDCSSTITTDIIPINVVVGGRLYNGSDVQAATLASPLFAPVSFSTTPHSTVVVPDEQLSDGSLNADYDPNGPGFGSGGVLSPGNSAPVQLQDATMRSQFNTFGGYHLILNPVVHPAITIDVPQNQGVLAQSLRGVVYPRVSISWWSAQLQNLMKTLPYMDPTHLPLFLTDSVMLYEGNPANCCVIGYHGAGKVTGNGGGSTNSNGNAVVQTFAWGSYVTPGIFNPQYDWALQDIHAISHEIAEWGDDPFTNNWVEPWLTPTAPQYGCTNILETGDPVVGIGFSSGTNSFRQVGAMTYTDALGISHTIQTTDGAYHPEDEVFLPWFVRWPANSTGSEPTQSGTGGRYTLMGDLNPYPGFNQPATGC
jgi:hypothetical protein